MKQGTLLFLRKGEGGKQEILLALKKRDFGIGKWNGVGGKVLPGESIEDAVRREAGEEIGVVPGAIMKVAELTFYNPPRPGKDVDFQCHIYFCEEWSGEPKESDEMRPQWFDVRNLPFNDMWADDPLWLPRVIAGEKLRGAVRLDVNSKITEAEFSAL